MQLSLLEQDQTKVDVLNELSVAYSDYDCNLSKNYATLSLNLSKKINYNRGELIATNRLGEILMFCDMNNIEAINKYNEAIVMASEIGDKEMELTILANIAYSNYEVDDYETAIEYYLKIIALTKNTQFESNYIHVNGYIGSIYLEQGDTIRGMQFYQQIYNYESNKGFLNMSIPNHYFIADYFLIKKAYDQAELFSYKAISILEKENRLRWLSYGYYFAGRINYEKGNNPEAINFGEKGYAIAEQKGFNRERIVNYQLLTDAYQSSGNYQKSNYFLNKEYNLKDSISSVEKLNQQHV